MPISQTTATSLIAATAVSVVLRPFPLRPNSSMCRPPEQLGNASRLLPHSRVTWPPPTPTTSALPPSITYPSRPSAACFVFNISLHLQNKTTALQQSDYKDVVFKLSYDLAATPPLPEPPSPPRHDQEGSAQQANAQRAPGVSRAALRCREAARIALRIPEDPILAGLALVGGDVAKVTQPLIKGEIVSTHECVSRIDEPE